MRRRFQKLKIKIYNDRVNSLLNEFFKEQIGKFQKVEPFDFTICDANQMNNSKYEKYFKNPTILENGNIYIGEWCNSKKNGKGIQVWNDGQVYEG